MIHIETLTSAVNKLTVTVETLVATLGVNYVPKGEYLADRRGDERRFSEIEGDLQTQAGGRRQLILGVLVAVAAAVIGVVISLARVGAGVSS